MTSTWIETHPEYDPRVNTDLRFSKDGDLDSDHIKLADLPEVVPVPEEGAEIILRYAQQNWELREQLTRSRRRATNQRRELKRLNKTVEFETALRRATVAESRSRIRDYSDASATVRKTNDELRLRVSQLEARLFEAEAKPKRGLFRR